MEIKKTQKLKTYKYTDTNKHKKTHKLKIKKNENMNSVNENEMSGGVISFFTNYRKRGLLKKLQKMFKLIKSITINFREPNRKLKIYLDTLTDLLDKHIDEVNILMYRYQESVMFEKKKYYLAAMEQRSTKIADNPDFYKSQIDELELQKKKVLNYITIHEKKKEAKKAEILKIRKSINDEKQKLESNQFVKMDKALKDYSTNSKEIEEIRIQLAKYKLFSRSKGKDKEDSVLKKEKKEATRFHEVFKSFFIDSQTVDNAYKIYEDVVEQLKELDILEASFNDINKQYEDQEKKYQQIEPHLDSVFRTLIPNIITAPKVLKLGEALDKIGLVIRNVKMAGSSGESIISPLLDIIKVKIDESNKIQQAINAEISNIRDELFKLNPQGKNLSEKLELCVKVNEDSYTYIVVAYNAITRLQGVISQLGGTKQIGGNVDIYNKALTFLRALKTGPSSIKLPTKSSKIGVVVLNNVLSFLTNASAMSTASASSTTATKTSTNEEIIPIILLGPLYAQYVEFLKKNPQYINGQINLNPAIPNIGMLGIQGMQGMPGILGISGMQGMLGMQGMQGMPGMPGRSDEYKEIDQRLKNNIESINELHSILDGAKDGINNQRNDLINLNNNFRSMDAIQSKIKDLKSTIKFPKFEKAVPFIIKEVKETKPALTLSQITKSQEHINFDKAMQQRYGSLIQELSTDYAKEVQADPSKGVYSKTNWMGSLIDLKSPGTGTGTGMGMGMGMVPGMGMSDFPGIKTSTDPLVQTAVKSYFTEAKKLANGADYNDFETFINNRNHIKVLEDPIAAINILITPQGLEWIRKDEGIKWLISKEGKDTYDNIKNYLRRQSSGPSGLQFDKYRTDLEFKVDEYRTKKTGMQAQSGIALAQAQQILAQTGYKNPYGP